MKKLIIIIALTTIWSCDSSTFDEIAEEMAQPEMVRYNEHIKPVIDANCIECHNPGGVSSFRPLTNYNELKIAVQETNLLERIQMQNGETGQMPQTGRMPQHLIDLILLWNEQGLLE